MQALEDKDIAIKLDKFQTKATPITDDELYAISYDKTARVKEGHANSINDAKFTKAAHALCANKNTETTPVLKTTGEKDPATNRLRLTVNDLVEMKRALDNLRVPSDGRRLVLCPDHVNDLLLTSQCLADMGHLRGCLLLIPYLGYGIEADNAHVHCLVNQHVKTEKTMVQVAVNTSLVLSQG